MLQMIFLLLTWLSAFLMMITFIGTLYLWANGRRVFKINFLTILLFAFNLILLMVVS